MPLAKNLSYAQSRRLAGAKAKEFSLESAGKVRFSYRNREDVTTLPPNIMIVGSHDVLTNVSGRIASRKGYTLDGASSSVLGGILSSCDYEMHTGTTQHLRAGFLTSAANDGKLQYRYVASNGTVTWRDLLTSLTSASFNFTEYWDTTHLQSLLLWVNGAASITEWTGGVTTIASVTSNTITKSGTDTWAETGFYTTGTHSIMAAGVVYQYTGGHGTVTITGVTPDPTGVVSPGDIAHQVPETTANTTMSLALTQSDLIANLRNQIYVAGFNNRSIYVSAVNNYKSYSFTSPVRVVGEGALCTLDGNPTALIPQESNMYVSAGMDQWYQTQFTLDATNAKEDFQIVRLKTGTLQGAQSQGLTSKIANYVTFVSNEPVLQQLGFVSNNLQVPQFVDLSYSIVNDVNSYDFTGGRVQYFQKFIYVSVPIESVMRVYNMTDSTIDPVTGSPQNHYWETPLTLPIGCFSIIDGELYGHNYNVPETYKLFSGYNDNGNFISSQAQFAFNSMGERDSSKSFEDFYLEGYISSNTTLNFGNLYDLDGCQTSTTYQLLGSDSQFVCVGSDDNLLGKFPLGSQPLGGNIVQSQPGDLPPKFRIIQTMIPVSFFEYSFGFGANGVDQQYEIVAFGPAWSPTKENQADITR